MKNKILINLKAFILFVLTTILSTNAAAIVLVNANSPLIPKNANFAPGDEFRLLFVTSDTTLPTATQISYYNNFVQNAASRNQLLRPFANEFRALASTADVHARDNTNTNSNPQASIYFIGGHKVADNYTDFYDGHWDLPITNTHPNRNVDFGGNNNFFFYPYNEYGASITRDNFIYVWTGTNANGTRATIVSNGWLGIVGTIERGLNASGLEIAQGRFQSSISNSFSLYGLSPLIKISFSNAAYTISTLTLKDPDFVILGSDYNDPGVSAIGIANGSPIDVSSDTIITRNNLNTNRLGHYQIVYTVADTEGNVKNATRNIYVVLNTHFDIDHNDIIKTSQDGIMIWHYLLGGKDENFIKRAVGKGARIATPSVLLAYVKYLADNKFLDINANGKTDSEDGKLILKYLIGFRGYNLTGLNLTGSRNSAASITNYFENTLTPPADWRQVNNAQWLSRYLHSSVAFENKIWVLGGQVLGTNGSHFNDVWSSADGIIWASHTTPAGNNRWSPHSGHSSVVFQGQMWVLGGGVPFVNDVFRDDTPFTKNEIWISSNGTTWTQKAASGTRWGRRHRHSSVVFNDKIWVLGGSYFTRMPPAVPFLPLYFNDVWSSTGGITLTWARETQAASWTARHSHSSVVFKNKIWVLGGYGGSYKNDVWFSNASGTIWTQATPTTAATAIWSARAGHSSFVFDDKIWVIGGQTGNNLFSNEIWSSADGVRWQKMNQYVPWPARGYHSMVILRNKLWLLGGNSGGVRNDVWSFGNQVQRRF